MKLFDILFCVLYRNIQRTNKSITEWSTITAISIILLFNLVSILAFLDIPFQAIGKIGMLIVSGSIITANYFYFLKMPNTRNS